MSVSYQITVFQYVIQYIIGLSAHLSLNIWLRLPSLGRDINTSVDKKTKKFFFVDVYSITNRYLAKLMALTSFVATIFGIKILYKLVLFQIP